MPSLIPQGDYTANIIDYKLSETKNGFPQIIIQFKETREGWEKWMFLSLKEGQAFEITMENLRVLGLEKGKEQGLIEGFGSHALDEDGDHKIRVSHEEYQGKVRDSISVLSPIKAKAMAPNVQRDIMNMIKADMVANASGPRAPRKPKDDSEEIPF